MTSLSKTVRVEVTAEDIAAAHTGFDCPVVRALNRTTGGKWAVSRGMWKGRSHGVGTMLPIGVSIRLSERVGRFVRDFDAYKPVEPFAFRVWR